MSALLVSAVLGHMGLASWMDTAIAMSVVLFGLMLARQQTLGKVTGLALIAVAASLHGVAHGAETPAWLYGLCTWLHVDQCLLACQRLGLRLGHSTPLASTPWLGF
jgi:hydrogenase/urease accessory protein HupE